MPIPPLNLDDRTFADLVDEVQALIPRYAPGWTNHNVSDPGIMLVELFAWLAEAMLYRINRVTPASRMRFLELLGAVFQPAQPAVLQLAVSANGLARPWVLRRGTRVDARTEIHATPVPFEIMQDLPLTPGSPTGVLTLRQSVLVEKEHLGVSDGKPYQLFKLKQAAIVLPKQPIPFRPQVLVGEERWEYRSDLRASGPNDLHFTIKPWLNAIVFGDSKRNRQPEPGLPIKVTYRTDPMRLRVIHNELVHETRNGTLSFFRLQHPLLALDLQDTDELEPLLFIGDQCWSYRPHFLDLAARACEFTVEPWINGVRLGDGVDHGEIPPKTKEISLTYRHTLGVLGNVPRGTTFSMLQEDRDGPSDLIFSSTFKIITPGTDRTELDGARDQVFTILKPSWRAITDMDFQELITQNHTEVVRVTPVPDRDLTGDASDTYQPGHISVILTPHAKYELSQCPEKLAKICTISADGRRLLALQQNDNGKTAQLWDMESQGVVDGFSMQDLKQAWFNPDSRRLIASGENGVTRLWNAENGELVTYLHPPVRQLGWSRDGEKVITVGADGIVSIWPIQGREKQGVFDHYGQAALSALSVGGADGERLAVVESGKTVIVWDVQNAQVVKTGEKWAVYHQSAPVNAIAFSGDGRTLAIAAVDQSVTVWDVTGGREPARLTSPAPVNAIALSMNGQLLATATNDTVTIQHVAQKQRLTQCKLAGPVSHLIFSEDGQKLAAAGGNVRATVWDIASGQLLAVLEDPSQVNALAFRQDGRYLAAAGADNKVYIRDLDTTHGVVALNHDAPVHTLAFHPNGQLLATAGPDGAVRVWAVHETERPQTTVIMPVRQLLFAPAKPRMAAIYDDGAAWLWDINNGSAINSLSVPPLAGKVVFSPSGQWLATIHDDRRVHLWDAGDGKMCASYPHENTPRQLLFSRTEKLLATLDDQNTVRLWRTQLRHPLSMVMHENRIAAITFLPDGLRFVELSDDSKLVKIWDIRDVWHIQEHGESQEKTPPWRWSHIAPVRAVFFNSNGGQLAITTGKALYLWNLEDSSPARVHEFPTEVSLVSFHSDSTAIAVAAGNKLYLWKSDDKSPVLLHKFPTEVSVALFSPDGREMAAAAGNLLCRWSLTDQPQPPWHEFPANIGDLYYGSTSDPVTMCVVTTVGVAVTVYTTLNTEGKYERKNLIHPMAVSTVSFSMEGSLLVTVAEDGALRVWDWAQGEVVAVYKPPAAVAALIASASRQQVVTVSDDNALRLWRIEREEPAAVFAHEDAVTGLAFSFDETRLVTWGNAAQLWSTRSRKKLASLVPALKLEQVLFDAAGHLLATVSNRRNDATPQGIIQLWNARNGEKVADLSLDAPVETLVFSPNGQRLVAIDGQNHVRIWKLVIRQREPLIVDTYLLLTLTGMDAIWCNAEGRWLATRTENLLSIWDIGRARQSTVFYHDHSHETIKSIDPSESFRNQCPIEEPQLSRKTQIDVKPSVATGNLLVTWFDSGHEGAARRIVGVWNAECVGEVQAFLAERGLITSRHHVAGVGYTNIHIEATIVRHAMVTQVAPIQDAICTALRAFFHPLRGGPERRGWPLARPVHASEIYQIIEGVDGVDHVESLTVMLGSGPRQASVASLARIDIPAHHLVNCRVQPDNFTIVSPGAVAVRHRMHRV